MVLGVQHTSLPGHAACGTQQAEQIARENPQGSRAHASAIALEPGVVALHVDFDDLAQRLQQTLDLPGIGIDLAARGLHASEPGGVGLLVQIGLDPARPEDGADRGGAENAQADLRAARHGLVEDAQRMADRRQADDRHGIAGQHEGVGNMVAQGRRGGCTKAEPERDGQQEQPGRLGKQRDHHHRHDGADHRADQPEDALGHYHARQRLGDDEHRHQRPLRLLQVETEGAPQRQAARQERLDREFQRQRIRREECLERRSHAVSRKVRVYRLTIVGNRSDRIVADNIISSLTICHPHFRRGKKNGRPKSPEVPCVLCDSVRISSSCGCPSR